MSRHAAKSAAHFKQLVRADAVKFAAETLCRLVVDEDVGGEPQIHCFTKAMGGTSMIVAFEKRVKILARGSCAEGAEGLQPGCGANLS